MMLFKCINIIFPMKPWVPVATDKHKPATRELRLPQYSRHVCSSHKRLHPIMWTVDSNIKDSPCPPPHLAPSPEQEEQQVVSQSYLMRGALGQVWALHPAAPEAGCHGGQRDTG